MEQLMKTLEQGLLDNDRDSILDILSNAKDILKTKEAINRFTNRYIKFVDKLTEDNDYEKIVEHTMLLIKFFESLSQPEEYDNYFCVKSVHCYYMDDFDCAHGFIEKALDTFKDSDDYSSIVKCYNKLGELELEMGNYHLAKASFQKGEAIVKKHFNSIDSIQGANSKINMIRANVYLKEWILAEELIRNYYMIMGPEGLPKNRMLLHSLRGDIARGRGRAEEAVIHYCEALVVAERFSMIKSQRDLYQNMAEVLETTERHRESVYYFKKLMELNNKFLHQYKHTLVVKAKTEFYLKQKEVEANRLREKNVMIKHQTDFDFLTGVHSRRFITNYLKSAFRKSIVNNKVMSLMIFDIDNFKRINDTYGHQVGDQVIRNVSQVVSESLSPDYKVGRIGGDEFVICFENTKLNEMQDIAGNLLKAVSSKKIKVFSDDINLTISAGLTDTTNVQAISVDNMLYIADQALYKAKADGKNRFFPV